MRCQATRNSITQLSRSDLQFHVLCGLFECVLHTAVLTSAERDSDPDPLAAEAAIEVVVHPRRGRQQRLCKPGALPGPRHHSAPRQPRVVAPVLMSEHVVRCDGGGAGVVPACSTMWIGRARGAPDYHKAGPNSAQKVLCKAVTCTNSAVPQ